MRLLLYLGFAFLTLSLLSPVHGRDTDQPQSDKMVALKKEFEARKKSRISYPDHAFESSEGSPPEGNTPIPSWLIASLLTSTLLLGAGISLWKVRSTHENTSGYDPNLWRDQQLGILQLEARRLFAGQVPSDFHKLEQAYGQALQELAHSSKYPQSLKVQLDQGNEHLLLSIFSPKGSMGQHVGLALAKPLANLTGASLSVVSQNQKEVAYQFALPCPQLAQARPPAPVAAPEPALPLPVEPIEKASLRPADLRFMEQMEAVALANLGEASFNAEAFREEMAMSKTQFYRKVQHLQNLSPGQYLRKLRLEKAKDLLLEGSYNVSEIAYEVGFNNLSYFAKCFKKEYGCLPSEV